MAIIESTARLAATLTTLFHTRIELASVEVEEESLRIYFALLFSLIALFCGGMAILLLAILVLVLSWDSHPVAALAIMAGIFALAGIKLALSVRNSYRQKPRLLAYSLAELSKDIEHLKSSSTPR